MQTFDNAHIKATLEETPYRRHYIFEKNDLTRSVTLQVTEIHADIILPIDVSFDELPKDIQTQLCLDKQEYEAKLLMRKTGTLYKRLDELLHQLSLSPLQMKWILEHYLEKKTIKDLESEIMDSPDSAHLILNFSRSR